MTKQLAVAGILADPDWAETTHDMEHDIVNPAVYETLRDGMKNKPKRNFTAPTGKIIMGDQRSIPNVECAPVETARSRIRSAGFEVEVDNLPVNSKCPAGTAAGTSPDGRTIKGGVVVIQISDGKGGGATPGPGGPGNTGPGTGRPPGRGGG